jgi:hypothetical protein
MRRKLFFLTMTAVFVLSGTEILHAQGAFEAAGKPTAAEKDSADADCTPDKTPSNDKCFSRHAEQRNSIPVSPMFFGVVLAHLFVIICIAYFLDHVCRKSYLPVIPACLAVVWIVMILNLNDYLNERAIDKAIHRLGEDRILYESSLSDPGDVIGGVYVSRPADDFVARLYKGGTIAIEDTDLKTIAGSRGWRLFFWGVFRGDNHDWINDRFLEIQTQHNIWASNLDFINPPPFAIGVNLVLLSVALYFIRRNRIQKASESKPEES